jgi:hypothetical protein
MKKLPVSKKKEVVKHLHRDIKTFKKEAEEDRELIKDLNKKKKSSSAKMKSKKGKK